MAKSTIAPLICVVALILPGLTACGKKKESEQAREPPTKEIGIEDSTESSPVKYSTVPLLKNRSEDNPLHDVFKKVEPLEDPEWNTEVLAENAKQQLKKIGKLLLTDQEHPLQSGAFLDLISPKFNAPPLRPELLEVFNDGALTVSRPLPLPVDDSSRLSRSGFLQATAQWRISFSKEEGCQDDSLRWKVINVKTEPDSKQFTTGVRLEVDGVSPNGERLSQVIELNCHWLGAESPILQSWEILRFEEIKVIAEGLEAQAPPFADHTRGLMRHSDSFGNQLTRGADYWYGNFDVAFGIQQGNQGISVCDVNGDGREDLFVCQPAGLPSRLYLQGEDGTMRDFTREAGLSWLDDARSALFIDLDDDGDEDLALGLGYSLTLHENDGTGRFRLRVEIDMFSWPSSIAASDYDHDGDLDIYVCGYTPRDDVAPGDVFANPVPYQDANNGARNFFIENRGVFDFADVTGERGFSQNNRRFSLAASWEDFDQDGDQDLYVANDFGRNNLYRNDLQDDGSRKFVDVAADAGVEDVAAGMSVSWGDYNRDGLMDLYISNMFSSAGGRIAFQRQFQNAADEEVRAQLQRHARGNTLYQNLGDGTFKDVSIDSGVTMGRWAWASHFVDLNNDAWEDLVVTNGFFTAEDTGDL
ncbi:VCBS repeat-containing protein (plasmid) [Verrucomicrobiaceae bacterium 227]